MMYFKVKKGYSDTDFFSIEEKDLLRALNAQVTGAVFICDEGSIGGNSIIGIEHDWNRMMGWNRGYKMTGEDYEYIGQSKLKKAKEFLAIKKDAVERKAKGLPPRVENPALSEASKQLSDNFQI